MAEISSKHRRFLLCMLGVICFLATSMSALAAEEFPDVTLKRPLWELGLVGFGAHLPHYPGSNQSQSVFLPFPFVTYRGEVIRADEQGLLRGILFESEKIEFDLSLNGSFPVFSDNNEAREGMEDLDWLGEIGPRLQFNISKTSDGTRTTRIDFNLPVRAAFSANFDDWEPDSQGVITTPELVYSNRNFQNTGVNFDLGISAMFASEDFMDYFYEVGDSDVRTGRARYDADAGYLGSRLGFSLNQQINDRLSGFLTTRVDLFQGATNLDSPLHKRDINWDFTVGFKYAIFQSDERVNR